MNVFFNIYNRENISTRFHICGVYNENHRLTLVSKLIGVSMQIGGLSNVGEQDQTAVVQGLTSKNAILF